VSWNDGTTKLRVKYMLIKEIAGLLSSERHRKCPCLKLYMKIVDKAEDL
jgi:hypothetical protein